MQRVQLQLHLNTGNTGGFGAPDGWDAASAGCWDEEEQLAVRRPRAVDDAPMTPVITLVLWTSIVVGCLRGYVQADVVAARQTPSYTKTFTQVGDDIRVASSNAFCATGPDGLPGVSWMELLTDLLPLVAPLFFARFLKYHGRRNGISVGCWLTIVGQVMLAAARSLVVLFLGNAAMRTASDLLFMAVCLQVVEIASRSSRGRFLMAHFLGVAGGSLIAATLGFFTSDQPAIGWRLVFGLGTLPAAAVLCVLPWMYETPHSLVQRGKFAQGWAALREIRGPFYDAYPEYQSILAAAASMPHSFSMVVQAVTNPVHRPALLMGMLMAAISTLLNPLTMTYVAYAAFRFASFPLRTAVFLTNMCITSSYGIGTLIAAVAVDRGRVRLLRISSVMTTLALLLLVVLHLASPQIDLGLALNGTLEAKWAWVQLGMLSLLAVGNGLAWTSAGWAIIVESQALVVRPAATALCVMMGGLAGALLERELLCVMGIKYYYVLLGISGVSMLVAALLIPETARVPLEEIPELWLNHWVWKHVVRKLQKRRARCCAAAAAADASGDWSGADARVPSAGRGPPPLPAASPGSSRTGPHAWLPRRVRALLHAPTTRQHSSEALEAFVDELNRHQAGGSTHAGAGAPW